jgi:hypothetical protein
MNQDRLQKSKWRAILHIIICCGTGTLFAGGMLIWLHTPPAKARQLQPLLKEIETYNATNGEYPTSCANFASFGNISKRYNVCTGSEIPDAEIEIYDFTILFNPEGYEIFLPATVTASDRLSFDFVAWRYDSKSHRWRKGRIRAPFAGSNWGIHWKPSFP